MNPYKLCLCTPSRCFVVVVLQVGTLVLFCRMYVSYCIVICSNRIDELLSLSNESHYCHQRRRKYKSHHRILTTLDCSKQHLNNVNIHLYLNLNKQRLCSASKMSSVNNDPLAKPRGGERANPEDDVSSRSQSQVVPMLPEERTEYVAQPLPS
jgi:hypothetical protein